jgi:hypothetical protein
VISVRYLRLLGVALAAAFALGAMVVATASAEDALFLQSGTRTGVKVSGKGGTLSTLSNFFGVTCTGASGNFNLGGNMTETFSGTIDFTGCNANSLGDPAGTILYKSKGLLCYISENPLEVGAYIEATETVHIEGLPFGLLVLFLSGSSQVGKVTPINTSTTTITLSFGGTGGDQSVGSCKDLGATLTPSIKAVENEKGETMGSLVTSLTLTFEEAVTVDG